MRPRMLMVAVALVFGTLAAPADAETVTFQSGNYADFRQLFAREEAATSASIAATLTFPSEARDRYPAIVIVHTIAGYQESNEGWHAAQFRKAGFATLTYESPVARSMLQGTSARSSGPWASAIAEAYAALRLLAGDPRIDASRVAIVGFSFGGEVAHLAAIERLRSALLPGDIRFAAHVAYYPAGVYGITADQGYTGAPILMLLGEKDENLPVAKAEGYFAYTKEAGTREAGTKEAGHPPPLDVVIYPGAYHAWTVPSLDAPRFYPQYPSTRKCPYLLLGPARPALLVDGQEKPMDLGVLQACLKAGQGYSMAYDESVRARSTRETERILLKHLRP